jgi:hypothetical protein
MECLGREIRVGRKHSVDRVQQFPHDGDVSLQGLLPSGDELVEEGGDPWLVLHGDQRWHVERPADVGSCANAALL